MVADLNKTVTTHILYIIYINFIYITCIIRVCHNNFINIININPTSPKINLTWLDELKDSQGTRIARAIAAARSMM